MTTLNVEPRRHGCSAVSTGSHRRCGHAARLREAAHRARAHGRGQRPAGLRAGLRGGHDERRRLPRRPSGHVAHDRHRLGDGGPPRAGLLRRRAGRPGRSPVLPARRDDLGRDGQLRPAAPPLDRVRAAAATRSRAADRLRRRGHEPAALRGTVRAGHRHAAVLPLGPAERGGLQALPGRDPYHPHHRHADQHRHRARQAVLLEQDGSRRRQGAGQPPAARDALRARLELLRRRSRRRVRLQACGLRLHGPLALVPVALARVPALDDLGRLNRPGAMH